MGEQKNLALKAKGQHAYPEGAEAESPVESQTIVGSQIAISRAPR